MLRPYLSQAVINQGYLMDCIAKAIALIGEALPRSLLSATLYPTRRMSQAIGDLCACILEFFIRAHTWYKFTASRKAISSIIRPAELKYDNLLDAVHTSSRYIDQLAEMSSRAELRDMSLQLETVSKMMSRC